MAIVAMNLYNTQLPLMISNGLSKLLRYKFWNDKTTYTYPKLGITLENLQLLEAMQPSQNI